VDPRDPSARPFSQTLAARACAIVLVVVSGVLLVWTLIPEMDDPSITLDSITYRIDLNSADETELSLLPNIGPKLARAIVEDRETNGSYETIEDLDRVKGIGPRTIEDLIGHVVQEPLSP